MVILRWGQKAAGQGEGENLFMKVLPTLFECLQNGNGEAAGMESVGWGKRNAWDRWWMEQSPRWWPALFWGGPGATGSCSPAPWGLLPRASASHAALVAPGLLFPGGSMVFSRPPLGKWVFAVERAERAPCRRHTGMSSIPVVAEHWEPWLQSVCAFGEQGTVPKPAGWHLCPGAPQSCGTGGDGSPHNGSLPVLCSCFRASWAEKGIWRLSQSVRAVSTHWAFFQLPGERMDVIAHTHAHTDLV